MKTIFGIIAMMFAFSVNAADVCANGKVVYFGDLVNDAGSEKLCIVPITNTWYFGSKDKDEKEYTYTIPSKVNPFNHAKGDEAMKGYEIILEGNKVVLAAIYKSGKLVQSIVAAKDLAMEFNPETTIYAEHN